MPTKTMSAAKTCLSLFALVSTGLIPAGAFASTGTLVAGVDDASVSSVNFRSGALLLDIDERITVEGDVSVEPGTTVYLNVSGESLIAANTRLR